MDGACAKIDYMYTLLIQPSSMIYAYISVVTFDNHSCGPSTLECLCTVLSLLSAQGTYVSFRWALIEMLKNSAKDCYLLLNHVIDRHRYRNAWNGYRSNICA